MRMQNSVKEYKEERYAAGFVWTRLANLDEASFEPALLQLKVNSLWEKEQQGAGSAADKI